MANNPGSDELQRAAEEAQRQLEGARDQLAQDQIASMQDSFASMADQSSDMLLAQERMQQQLQDAMERALAERESGENPNSRGMTLMEEMELADMKEELAADLQRLQQQMMNTMQQFGEETPAAARALAEGNETISERELELALSDAALYIDAGYALYIAGNERNVTEGMRALNESLERAEQLALGSINGRMVSLLNLLRRKGSRVNKGKAVSKVKANNRGSKAAWVVDPMALGMAWV
jgi:hypothetical protein